MFKRMLLLTILLPLSIVALAKKRILPIELVAAQAYIIVTGEIIAVGSDTYDLKVSEYIKGDKGNVITVQQFEQWICDTRYAPVAKGQKLILFLQMDHGNFIIINGSTGEIPIKNNRVILQYEEYKHIPYQLHYELDLTEFKEGIKKFLQCFDIMQQCKDCSTDTLVRKCSDTEINKFIGASRFTAWLYNKIKSGYKISVVP